MASTEVALLESVPIPDIFCSGVGAIEEIDGCLRFYLYVSQQSPNGGEPEKIVVAKIVTSATLVSREMIRLLALAGAKFICGAPVIVDGRMH